LQILFDAKKEIKTGDGVSCKGVPSVCRAEKQNIKITRPPPQSFRTLLLPNPTSERKSHFKC